MSCNYLKQERENIYRVIAVIMSIPSNLRSYFLHVIVLEKLCKFIKIVSMKVLPPGYCNCNISIHVQNLICCILLFTSL
jgi:hypothetical protein